MDVGLRYIPVTVPQTFGVGGTALGLTVPTGATYAICSIETSGVRFRDDGIAPNGSVGVLLPVGTLFEYSGNLAGIQFIAATGPAVINVAFYKVAG